MCCLVSNKKEYMNLFSFCLITYNYKNWPCLLLVLFLVTKNREAQAPDQRGRSSNIKARVDFFLSVFKNGEAARSLKSSHTTLRKPARKQKLSLKIFLQLQHFLANATFSCKCNIFLPLNVKVQRHIKFI